MPTTQTLRLPPTQTLPLPLIERAAARLRAMLERSEHQLRNLESGLVELVSEHDSLQEDRDTTRRVVDSIRGDMFRIRRALDRIDAGTYGRCVTCGATVRADRLDAIPDADRCTSCA